MENDIVKKFAPNPKGWSGIKDARKTGPITDTGKLKSLLSTGFNLKNETPLLKRIRQCDKCPLGEKLIKIQVGDKIIQRSKPAECAFYEKGKTECVVPVSEWAMKVRMLYALSEEQGSLDLHRALILQAAKHATTAEESEIVTKGRPGWFTEKFLKLALEGVAEYNKIISSQSGDKHLHLHQEKGDLAERIVNKIFPEDEEDK